MKRLRRYPFTTLAVTILLVIGISPWAASAYTPYQYALNRQVDDFTITSSVVGTIVGGKMSMGVTVTGAHRVVIQTWAPGGGLIYASTNNAYVTLTHGAISGVQSRCYWYNTFGPISGTLPVNCWRYV